MRHWQNLHVNVDVLRVHAAGKRFTAIVMCPPQLPNSLIEK
jgi:hypothetical protein